MGTVEEIDSCDLLGMVLQERSPRLGRRFTLLGHVFRHGRIHYFEAEQFQFRLDSGSAPGRVLAGHLSDQIPDFIADPWPSDRPSL